MKRKITKRVSLIFLTYLSIVLSLYTASTSSHVIQAQTAERCFPETGYCISGPIRAYWERNGGLPVFGYPITAQRNEQVEGTWEGPVQWFERDRLEDHGSEGVLAGRLGVELLELGGLPWEYHPTVAFAPPGCTYFDTHHSLCQPFLSYWIENGGLERFGYPITEPYENITIDGWTGTVQYFERRRMEHHTEFRGTQYEVLLGLLGNEIRQRFGLSPLSDSMSTATMPIITDTDTPEAQSTSVLPPTPLLTNTATSTPSLLTPTPETVPPSTAVPTSVPPSTSTPTSTPTSMPTSPPTPTSTPTSMPTSPPTPTSTPTSMPTSPPTPTHTPTSTPTPPPTPTSMPDQAEMVRGIVKYTNNYRRQHGCGDLKVDDRLTQAAQGHSEDMAFNDFFSHTGSQGTTPFDRIKATGYTYSMAAENIFAGARSPEEAVDGWYNSEGHRKNMLNCELEYIGVGYYYLEHDTGSVNFHTYWTQVFATP